MIPTLYSGVLFFSRYRNAQVTSGYVSRLPGRRHYRHYARTRGPRPLSRLWGQTDLDANKLVISPWLVGPNKSLVKTICEIYKEPQSAICLHHVLRAS